ncbi:hypothetical protein D3C83_245130 [compost metagenome]
MLITSRRFASVNWLLARFTLRSDAVSWPISFSNCWRVISVCSISLVMRFSPMRTFSSRRRVTRAG